jgi:5'-nucleotidase
MPWVKELVNKRFQIFLTNDDGIASPGLFAAAEALSDLGYVTVAAPRDQASATGRSMPGTSDGAIIPTHLQIKNQDWTAFSVGGTPAQVVQHGILEIMPCRPDLVVAGINYGENLGQSITISGTLGAAMEAAALGVPAMAVSLQLLEQAHFSNLAELDFSAAAYFTQLFARMILEKGLPDDTDVLKVEVPAHATPITHWRMTSLAKHRYYQPAGEQRKAWNDKSTITYHSHVNPIDISQDSDIYAVLFEKVVSVTPLTLDMTARINIGEFDHQWHNGT